MPTSSASASTAARGNDAPTWQLRDGLDPADAARLGAGAALHLDPDSAHLSTLLGQWGSILRELRLLANRP